MCVSHLMATGLQVRLFDNSVRIWDGIMGNYITKLEDHVGPVFQISWSPDSSMLLTGSKDSTLKVWDIRTIRLKQYLPGHADQFVLNDQVYTSSRLMFFVYTSSRLIYHKRNFVR